MTPDRRRIVITGLGIVSPAGTTPDRFWATLRAGTSCVREIGRFDASCYPTRIAAQMDDAEIEDEDGIAVRWRCRGRIAQYAALAAASAMRDAGLPPDPGTRSRTGIAVASGMGTYDHEEIFGACGAARSARDDEFDWIAFAASLRQLLKPCAPERRTPGSIPAALAREHGLGGPVMSVMTACAGGTQAIGDAIRWIRTGRADAALAGGADSEIYPMGLASFCLLGALSRRNDRPRAASRPFDAHRDGFVMGEGAGMLVLEEREHAIRRGARIYAEASGFGSASDAYRVTDPHPDGTGAVLAMRRALADARLSPDHVSYVNAHGTSTVANDRIETHAIRTVFGERAARLAVSSTKSMIGHATVAAGAIEAVAVALTLSHQVIHPTINLETPDPECDLDYVPHRPRAVPVQAALSNSFAFGGQSAALLLTRHEG